MIFGTLIILILALSVWRRLHQRYAAVKFKYKIYALRDRLRKLAIEGKIDSEHWVFDFFDNSFSKAISGRYYLTLSRFFILSIIHQNEEELEEFSEKLESVLLLNSELEQLESEYFDAIKSYVRDQHYVSFNFIIKPIVILIFGTATAALKFNQWLKGSLVYPETSDSGNFVYN